MHVVVHTFPTWLQKHRRLCGTTVLHLQDGNFLLIYRVKDDIARTGTGSVPLVARHKNCSAGAKQPFHLMLSSALCDMSKQRQEAFFAPGVSLADVGSF